MCQECGCGIGGDSSKDHHHHHHHDDSEHHHPSDESHHEGHHQHHQHSHQHEDGSFGHDHPARAPQVLAVQRSLLERNARLAEQNRGFFRAKKLLVLNILSAPGSGKTTLIQKTAELLKGKLRLGVVVGDLATDNDAERLRASGLPVVQITTGTLCHLEADMVARAANQLDLDALDVLVIENVGNLVCPAGYDLGEQLRVVLLSVTEGEDKPLKYPPLFHSANIALITKSELAGPAGFNREKALANLKRVSHHAEVFELSARTGEGMQAWIDSLLRAAKSHPSPHAHAH